MDFKSCKSSPDRFIIGYLFSNDRLQDSPFLVRFCRCPEPLCLNIEMCIRDRVYSTENALMPIDNTGAETKGSCSRPAPGSVAFVPAVAGLIAAGEVIRDLTGHNRR